MAESVVDAPFLGGLEALGAALELENMTSRAQWMWVGSGALGLHSGITTLEEANPLNWSELRPLIEVHTELEQALSDEHNLGRTEQRPVRVKFVRVQTVDFGCVGMTVQTLEHLPKSCVAQWMWADVGVLGFRRLAESNPLRWSAAMPVKQLCQDIMNNSSLCPWETFPSVESDAAGCISPPVRVHFPESSVETRTVDFVSLSEAVDSFKERHVISSFR